MLTTLGSEIRSGANLSERNLILHQPRRNINRPWSVVGDQWSVVGGHIGAPITGHWPPTTTNIRLRWSRGGYGIASALQTFGSAGAGEDMECLGATNIRLRWSRGGYEI